MRPTWIPLAALLFLGVTMAAPRVDACMGPPMWKKQQQPAGSIVLGTTTAVVTWDETRQTTTLIPEVKGDLRKFSLLIPVRGKISRKDLKVLSDEVHYQLLARTKPSVEVSTDKDPCAKPPAPKLQRTDPAAKGAPSAAAGASKPTAADYGVAVEAHYEIGEYDLAVLRARSARGLGAWLRRFKYTVTPEVERALGGYLKSGYRLLVARVHLKKLKEEGFSTMRPLQIRSSRRGKAPGLPLRVAAAGASPQDLIVLTLGEHRSDLVAHRMLELPREHELPAFVADDWDAEYAGFAANWMEKFGGASAALLEFAGPAPVMELGALGAKPGAFLTRWRLRVRDETPDVELRDARADDLFQSVFRARALHEGRPSCKAGRRYFNDQRRVLEEQASHYALLRGGERGAPLDRLRKKNPYAFHRWREPTPPRPTSELKIKHDEGAESGGISGWWTIVGAFFGFMIFLITVGRIQRGR